MEAHQLRRLRRLVFGRQDRGVVATGDHDVADAGQVLLAHRPEHACGDGLFAGMRFTDPDTGEADPATAKRVVEAMYRKRVLISRVGRHDEVLKIRPPLAFERAHAELVVDRLTQVIAGL